MSSGPNTNATLFGALGMLHPPTLCILLHSALYDAYTLYDEPRILLIIISTLTQSSPQPTFSTPLLMIHPPLRSDPNCPAEFAQIPHRP